MFLSLANLASSFCQIFLVNILSLISNGEHASLRDDVAQVGTVESIGQLFQRCYYP